MAETTAIPKIAPEGTDASEQLLAERRMCPELKEISDRWLEEGNQTNEISLRQHYRRCCDIDLVRSKKDVYGDEAAELLFDRHALSRDTIKDYHEVGQRIDKKTFAMIEALNAKATKAGRLPFSKSHLTIIAKLVDGEGRVEMIRRAINEGWVVRRLRDAVGGLISSDPEAGVKPAQEMRPTATTNKIHKVGQQFIESMIPLDSEDFLLRLDSVKPHDIERTLENIQEARSVLQEVRDSAGDRLITLQSAEQSLRLRLEQLKLAEQASQSLAAKVDTEASKEAAKQRAKGATATAPVAASPKKLVKKVARKDSAGERSPAPVKKKLVKKVVKKSATAS